MLSTCLSLERADRSPESVATSPIPLKEVIARPMCAFNTPAAAHSTTKSPLPERSLPERSLFVRLLWIGLLVALPLSAFPVHSALAQEAAQEAEPPRAAAQDDAGQDDAGQDDAAARPAASLEVSDEVRQALGPVLQRSMKAESLRATVKMSVNSAIGDEVLGTNEGLFQIASEAPNRLALSAKFQSEQVQFVSDGEQLYVQLTPEAYVVEEAPASFEDLVSAMPVQLGPQPEPMLWLSVAGINPARSLLSGLSSIEMVGREAIGDVDAAHLRGVRPEGVQWELYVSVDDQPRPLALVVDMTEMITKSNNLQVPEGYSFTIRYDFERWQVDAELDPALFEYRPPTEAERFESVADYLTQSNERGPHPLLGKPAPEIEAQPLEGEPITVGGQRDEVLVLEFWATWCGPCVAALPKMEELAERFADRGVKLYAVNVNEPRDAVQAFLQDRELELPVLLDPEGRIASAYAANAIPQTVLIGKGGRVEAVHVGFDAEESYELLVAELELLIAGRQIYQAEEVEEPAAGDDEEGDRAADEQPDAAGAAAESDATGDASTADDQDR